MIILEGKRDNELGRYLPYFDERGISMNISKLKQILLSKFVNEGGMHNLSLGSNFYLLGVARYYFQGNLTNGTRSIDDLGIFSNSADDFNSDICGKLNYIILCARNGYIEDYYDKEGKDVDAYEDFGGVSLGELFDMYPIELKEYEDSCKFNNYNDDIEYDENDNSAGSNGYTFDIMYNQHDCQKYNSATEPGAWCITYGQVHYDSYIELFSKYGGIHYIVFRENGYENIPRKVGKNYPCDEYGNSLICVLQRNDCPEPTYITSRWNHGGKDSPHCEADHAYSKEEFLRIIGDDGSILDKVYNIWKKNKGEEEYNYNILNREKILNYKYYQMLLDGGRNVSELFNKIEVISGDINKFRKCICQVSLDEGKTWCMCIKGRLICNKIGIGRFWKTSNGDNFIEIYCSSGIEDEDVNVMINKKFNCYLDYDSDFFVYVNMGRLGESFKKFANKFNFHYLQNYANRTFSLYNPIKNNYFRLPNGEIVFNEVKEVGNDGNEKNDNTIQLLKFVYHLGRDYDFYYDMENFKFIDMNNEKFKNFDIVFKFNNYIGLRNNCGRPDCYIYDISTSSYLTLCNNQEFTFLNYCGFGIICFGLEFNQDKKHYNGFATYDLTTMKEILDKSGDPLDSNGDCKCNKNLIVLKVFRDESFYVYDCLHHRLILYGGKWDEFGIFDDCRFKEKGLQVDYYDTDNIIPYPNDIQENIFKNFKRFI